MSHSLVPPDPLVAYPNSLTPPFACSCTDGGLDAAWVQVAGELDLASAPELRRMLRESQQKARLVVLDLRELSFIDCAGLDVIVSAAKRARQSGARLVLVRGAADVDRVFTLTSTADDMEIVDLKPGKPPTPAFLHLVDGESMT
jgi:anti-sigma B factor antagonist